MLALRWRDRALNQREYAEIVFNSSLSPLAKLLYAYLRSCMDWDTCIVGDADKKMISYQSIREHLEYIPRWGSTARPVDLSRDQVKRLLAALVDAGAVVRLKGQRYGVELRFFLPLASAGQVRTQEERHRSAIVGAPVCISGEERSESLTEQGFQQDATPPEEARSAIGAPYHERHTSLLLLSPSNQYIQYDPDEDDWRWMRYTFGADSQFENLVDIGLETEKFNLKYCNRAGYDMSRQSADWRVWMIRAVEYSRGRQ